ncbi:zinc-finger domain-containing protein [Paenibacillus apii]|uniref:zinc-finger domain-containing protein n=1 Tax=Paenibacillus apii TaxID=1850370 RepID=UPI001438BCD6|nr:zinc-finger domain-containing protein [Paenibacillus apii]
MERKDVIKQIDKILRTKCDVCEMKKLPGYRKSSSNRLSHYCINECEVGQKIQGMSVKLNDTLPRNMRKGQSA